MTYEDKLYHNIKVLKLYLNYQKYEQINIIIYSNSVKKIEFLNNEDCYAYLEINKLAREMYLYEYNKERELIAITNIENLERFDTLNTEPINLEDHLFELNNKMQDKSYKKQF